MQQEIPSPSGQQIFDVAVIGMGPVGASLAALLAQRGLRVLAMDAAAGIYDMPRAIGMDHEVMRVFQQLGLAEALADVISPYHDTEYRAADGQVLRHFTSPGQPHPLGWPHYLTFVQPELETVLRRHVATAPGIDLRLSTELVALTQMPGHVELQMQARPGGGVDVARARYVVGCDGGGSFVRKACGIAFEDLVFDEPWVVVDLLVEDGAHLPETNVQYCDPARPHTFVIGPRKLRRWEFKLLPGESPAEMCRDDQVWRLLQPWLRPDQARLWRAAAYRFHALVAQSWRQGRVLLAGDACHMTPPFLAQGMVQGIKDSANLAWKLAAVVQGAPEALLDSYAAERRPTVHKVISITKALGELICECDPERAAARNHEMRAQHLAAAGPLLRQNLFPALPAGPLVADHDPVAGHPAPQPVVWGPGGACLLDDLTGAAFRVLARPGFRPAAAAAAMLSTLGIRLHHIATAEEEGALRERDGLFRAYMDRHGLQALLVRPDHMILAGLADAAQLTVRLQQLQAVLGPCAPGRQGATGRQGSAA